MSNLSQCRKRWRKDPVLFPYEALKIRERGYELTEQQKDAFRELGKLCNAKYKAYILLHAHIIEKLGKEVKYNEEVGGVNVDKILSGKMSEEEIAYSKKIGISIMAGKGVGKDAFLAMAILFFLTCFAYVKSINTAPTEKQLKTILWSEIHKWGFRVDIGENGEKIVPITKELFTWQSEKVYFTELKGKEYFALAKTANVKASEETQAKTLDGFHEDYQLFGLDESSNLPDPVFKPFETTLTGIINIVINIFNPTRNNGFAYETHYRDKKYWICLQWSALECEQLVPATQIEYLAKKYGEDSNEYRINVLGLPPKESGLTLIPRKWVEAARDSAIEIDMTQPLVFGVDVGGDGLVGNDDSVILKRRGPVVVEIMTFSKVDTMLLASWVAHEIMKDEPDAVYVDVVGIGAGVVHRLLQLGYFVIAVNSCEVADNDTEYGNIRAEMHWEARTRFEARTIKIPDDIVLFDEICNARPRDPDAKGRKMIMSKKEMRTKGIPSPNRFDALLLSLRSNDLLYTRPNEKKDIWDEEETEAFVTEDSFMAV